jgi:hypothetical protein
MILYDEEPNSPDDGPRGGAVAWGIIAIVLAVAIYAVARWCPWPGR